MHAFQAVPAATGELATASSTQYWYALRPLTRSQRARHYLNIYSLSSVLQSQMKLIEDPRAWLRPHKEQPDSKGQQASSTATCSKPKHVTHGLPATMAKAGEFQNMLTAVPHPLAKTGYKDPRDPCNRTDKRNGGQYRRFESSYSKHYASIDDKPIQFREDGLPISARMVPGKPLMAPKLPNAADMSIAKRLFKKYNHSSSVCIGLPGNKDPQQFKSVYAIVHNAPRRQLAQPNSGMTAEDAARAHHSLGLYN